MSKMEKQHFIVACGQKCEKHVPLLFLSPLYCEKGKHVHIVV